VQIRRPIDVPRICSGFLAPSSGFLWSEYILMDCGKVEPTNLSQKENLYISICSFRSLGECLRCLKTLC
jgi:hypothetical protein